MTTKIKTVVMVGAGNLATQLANALYESNYSIQAIYSHTLKSAHELGQQVKCNICCNNTQELPTDADLYIYALKDQFLSTIIQQMPPCTGIHIHTAGSLPLSIFEEKQQQTGVFYPFQTFSKAKRVTFDTIPIFIETSDSKIEQQLQFVAHSLSNQVYTLSSEDRKILHITGVFACNFTNYLWQISSELLKIKNLPFQVVQPLIEETVNKLKTLRPDEAQTGPAVREDIDVMKKHIQFLHQSPDLQKIYQLLSHGIMCKKDKNK